jgi:hypothetical protein
MYQVPTHLTVLMIDDIPLRCIGAPISLRRVTIELTPEQRQQLTPRYTGRDCGVEQYEMHGQLLLEYER